MTNNSAAHTINGTLSIGEINGMKVGYEHRLNLNNIMFRYYSNFVDIYNYDNTKSLAIYSGNQYSDGPYLIMYLLNFNNNDLKDYFVIGTASGGNSLQIKSNSTLLWNNNSLFNIAVKQKSITNDGYISFLCGLIIQWGSFILTDEQVQKTFPIPISYNVQFYGLYVSNQNGTKQYFAYSNNLANITVGELTGYAANPLMWFSLGK